MVTFPPLNEGKNWLWLEQGRWRSDDLEALKLLREVLDLLQREVGSRETERAEWYPERAGASRTSSLYNPLRCSSSGVKRVCNLWADTWTAHRHFQQPASGSPSASQQHREQRRLRVHHGNVLGPLKAALDGFAL